LVLQFLSKPHLLPATPRWRAKLHLVMCDVMHFI